MAQYTEPAALHPFPKDRAPEDPLAKHIIIIIYAQESQLEIQPNQKLITKEVGGSIALTCRPNVEDHSLIRDLEWRDPKDRTITNNKESSIRVQNSLGDLGLVLIFSSLTENQSGNYTCRASYASEPLTSSVKIKTYVAINFVDAPENQYPIAGKSFSVKCIVTGNPAPNIVWNKDDRPITTNEKFVVDPTGLLIINNVTELDDGVYKCTAVVAETGEIRSRNIKVEVQVPPTISQMDDITVIDGETASIKCNATGKPPPSYQWIKLRERQDLAVTDRFEVKRITGQLIMNQIKFEDDGVYKCIAENTVDRVEATVRINVLVRPRIYELWNVTAPIATETKLICKVYGRPPPRVTFRKLSSREPFVNGRQPEDHRITLEQEFFKEKNEGFGTLIISNLSRTDDGLYECIAENSAGISYKNGHVAVEFPPTFARTKDLPPVWSWDEKPGNLTCLPEAIPNATIVWKYGNIEIRDNQNFQQIGRGPVSNLIVRPYNERKFFTYYECLATNKLGSASIKIQLRHAEVPRSLSQIKPGPITATTVKWSLTPANHFDGLPIQSFTVQYKPNRQLGWDFASNHTWSYGAPYILENLVPEETYDFRFAAKNAVGMGPFTNAESITMPRRSQPAEPTILYHNPNTDNTSNRDEFVIPSPYADHYEVRWSVPNDNGDPIQNYFIRYCVTEKFNGQWRDKDCSEQIPHSVQYTTYQLSNLSPDTVYKIELRAHNAIGDSSPAQIRVRTAR
ncbi:hypothetical protein NQ317_014592, partial [Molorchus minor]